MNTADRSVNESNHFGKLAVSSKMEHTSPTIQQLLSYVRAKRLAQEC